MKKKIGIALAVVATAVISIVSLVGCAKPVTDLKLVDTQTDALLEVQANTADIAIVDGVMADYTLAQEGNSYDKLTMIDVKGFTPEAESYGVAAKLGNTNLINYINKRLYELNESGKYMEILKKYGVEGRKVAFTEPTGEWENWKSEIVNNKITIGFTLAPPYGMGSNNKPEGLDFDLAKEVFKDDNITIEGKIINWDDKITELNSNYIDLVWNGMTIRDEFKGKIEVSVPYMKNSQVLVVSKKNAEKFKSIEDLKGYVIVAEKGSAGRNAGMLIFSKVDKETFKEWLTKNPTDKQIWETENPNWDKN